MSFPVISFVLLFTVAMLSLWYLPQRDRTHWLSWCLFVGALTVCLWQGWLQPLGLLWIGLLITSAYLYRKFEAGWQHDLSLIVLMALSLALAIHALPGFSAIPVFAEQDYRNLDKACVAFVLLALVTPRIVHWRELQSALAVTWPSFLIAPIVLFSLVWWLGGIDMPRFGTFQYFWLWAWGNLLVTCVAEELFFRGLVQRYLTTKWRDKRFGWLAAICLASLLFGLAHIGGGLSFVLLASVAGLFYGTVYHLSRRIEIAILLHFVINLLYVVF